jgi:phage-related protein
MQVSFENLAEVVGGILAPAFNAVLGALIPVFSWVSKNAALVATVAAAVAVGAGAWIAYSTALKVAAAFQAIMNGTMALNPIGLVIAAVALLAIVIVRNWSKIKAVTLAVWGKISGIVLPVWGAISTAAQIMFRVVSTIAKAIFTVWAFEFKAIWAVFNAFKAAIIGGWHAIRDVAKGIWDGVLGAAKAVFNAIANLWNHTIGEIGIHFHHLGVNIDFDVPNIPTLATGGMVTRTGLALVHEGERFSGVGGDWGNVYVTVNGSVMTEHDLAKSIQKALLKDKRRSGALGLA